MSGFFLYFNTTGDYCLRVCPSGYIRDHTSNKCATSLVDISEAQSAALVAAFIVTSTALTVSSGASDGFSTTMLMCLVATECLANMQFLNINHSNLASTVYSAMSSSFIPNWIISYNDLDKEMIIFNWGIFEKNQISALYLDNFGDSLLEIMIYLGLFLLSVFLTISPKMKRRTHPFGEKAHITTFSFLMATILGNIQSQILFSTMQIIKLHLFYNKYSALSLLTAMSTMSILLGLLLNCFRKLMIIFKYQQRSTNLKRAATIRPNNTRLQIRLLKKKYEFMISDFKSSNANQFFFVFWITAFSIVYILSIFCFQSVPRLQCLSIVVLVAALIFFSAKVKPFKEKVPAFLHFFNFTCVLIAAILNLALAFSPVENSGFSHETQGVMVISVIITNTAANGLFSIGGMIYDIYHKIKLKLSKNKNLRTDKTESKAMKTQSTANGLIGVPGEERVIADHNESSNFQNNERSLNLSTTNFIDHSSPQRNLRHLKTFSEPTARKRKVMTVKLVT